MKAKRINTTGMAVILFSFFSITTSNAKCIVDFGLADSALAKDTKQNLLSLGFEVAEWPDEKLSSNYGVKFYVQQSELIGNDSFGE